MTNIEIIRGSKGGKTFTAASFLEYMRKSADHWWDTTQDTTQCPWVFRGHWNADFKLLPTAARASFNGDSQFERLAKEINNELDNNCEEWKSLSDDQKDKTSCFFAHYRSIEKFITIARELNFSSSDIPAPWDDLCERLVATTYLSFNTHPFFSAIRGIPAPLYNLHTDAGHNFLSSNDMALAQHHGMATYLLDWTKNPITACYFASTKPSIKKEPIDLAIWALNTSTFTNIKPGGNYYDFLGFSGLNIGKPSISIIKPASANNEYLSSQSGVLTYTANLHWEPDTEQVFPDLETLINSYDRNLILSEYEANAEKIYQSQMDDVPPTKQTIDERLPEGHTYLRKVILPASELSEYRKLLLREGISKAHLMPTLDNIAATARTSLLNED